MKKVILACIVFFYFTFNAFSALNLNTATLDQLKELEGVGQAKAQAIVEYRNKNGHFKNVDELNNVPGFSDNAIKKLKPTLTVTVDDSTPTNAVKLIEKPKKYSPR
jgi:competence protein ComEA